MDTTNRDKSLNDIIIEKRVARQILNIIENICFSDNWKEYRVNYGSNGQRDKILETIKRYYDVQ